MPLALKTLACASFNLCTAPTAPLPAFSSRLPVYAPHLHLGQAVQPNDRPANRFLQLCFACCVRDVVPCRPPQPLPALLAAYDLPQKERGGHVCRGKVHGTGSMAPRVAAVQQHGGAAQLAPFLGRNRIRWYATTMHLMLPMPA